MADWNYLKSFCRLLEKTEVPPRFAIWSGIASLLAGLERRIWINQGVYSIYPNFYLVLVAASGQKKSTAINAASKILRRLSPGPNVISQKITPEALIQAIQCQANDPKVVLKMKNGGIVIADELATFLDRQALDKGLGPILTALYDCTPFEYATKARGVEKVEDGYLSMLGGTTIELLKNSLPKDAIGGGFTSRTMFVYEDKVAAPIAWIDFDQELVDLEQELVNYLQRLMELEGAVTMTPEAKAFFIHDYEERHKVGEFRNDPLLRSYENRRHAHLWKVAMALMVAEAPQRTMELQHIRGAKFILEEAEVYLPRVVELIAASETGMAGSLVMNYIEQKSGAQGFVLRRDLMRHFAHRFDSLEITKMVDTLVKSERIKIDTSDGQLVYRKISADKGRIRV